MMVIYLLFELCSFFRTRNKLESCKKVCENKDFCNVVIPSEDTKIVELDQYQRSNKAPYITNADLESPYERLMDVKIFQKNYLQQN